MHSTVWVFLTLLTATSHSLPVTRVLDNNVQYILPYTSKNAATTTDSFQGNFDITNATHYLRAFGYLPQRSHQIGIALDDHVSQEDLENALRSFQQFANLPVTGILDKETTTRMQLPRCGMRDVNEEADMLFGKKSNFMPNSTLMSMVRRKRYSIEGSYWGVQNITYQISKYTTELRRDKVDWIIEKAFKVWEEHSPLRFTKRDQGPANIEIMFAGRSHGDGEPFDGRGGILAHAFFPRYGGDVHFDEDEPWRAPETRGTSRFWLWNRVKTLAKRFKQTVLNAFGANGIDLYSVAAHEIGHSLGLKHTTEPRALMAPFYQAYTGDTIQLHSDDIRGLQHLYGTPQDRASTDGRTDNRVQFSNRLQPLTTPSSNPTRSPPQINSTTLDTNFNICSDTRIDAVTVLGNGSTYAFKSNLYWRLNQVSFDRGYPRQISEDWDGLESNIDAAITDYDGDTYFFKGDKYWLYDPSGRRYKGYPRKISVGLVDTPDNLDAALIWSGDDNPYFFRGDKFWQYSRWGMPTGWPRSTKNISENLPNKIDAAFKWNNDKSYLFAGNKYYRLTSYRTMTTVENYPRETGEWWFGCPRVDSTRYKRDLQPTGIDYSDK